jgi:parallel beta-helix repeat protein
MKLVNIANVAILFFTALTVVNAQSVQKRKPDQQGQFVHPGMMQNRQDLDYMKKKVLAGEQPWKDAFDRLKSEAKLDLKPGAVTHIAQGPYGAGDIGGRELSNSAAAAYNDALLWYITGDKVYAEKAISLINAWSYTLWDFDGNNAKLLAGLSGHYWLNAAEILKYSNSGWKPKDVDQFKRFMLTVYYPFIKDFFPEANGNWDAAMTNTMLDIAIFCDDHAMFNRAVERYYCGIGNGGITKYIYPDGQIQETTRDWGHVQLGIGEFAKAAQVAWTQGVDFYGVADNRLALGFEYASKYLSGEKVPVYGVISTRAMKPLRDIYESIYYHYHVVKGLDMPYTYRLTEQTRPKTSDVLLVSLRAPIAGMAKIKTGPPSPVTIAQNAGALTGATIAPPANAIVVAPGSSIQTALDACANKGGWVILAKGVHQINAALHIPSGVTLSGQGNESILFLDPKVSDKVIVNADNEMHDVTLRDFLIEGALTTVDSTDPNSNRRTRSYQNAPERESIVFSADKDGQMHNIHFEHLTVQNFTKDGVSVRGASHVVVDSCDFSDNGSSVVPGPGIHHNLQLTHITEIKITNSRFDTSPFGSGIDLTLSSNAIINSNEAGRNKLQGIRVADCKNVQIDRNITEGNDKNGILVDVLMDVSAHIGVKNNFSHNNGERGIAVKAIDGTIANNTLADNGQK